MTIDINTVDKVAFLSRLKIDDNVKEETKEEKTETADAAENI